MSDDGAFVFECPPPEEYFEHGGENYYDLLQFDDNYLLWGCFCGRPRIEADGLVFTPRNDFTPLPHILLTFNRVASELAPGACDEYAFTESSDFFAFRRFADEVAMASSYTWNIAAIPVGAMREEVARASAGLVADIEWAHPRILEHPDWPDIRGNLGAAARGIAT